jgi:hypothetical protein
MMDRATTLLDPGPARRLLAAILTLVLLLPSLALAPPAGAAGCVVTSGEDSGTGTLRAALDTVANGGCAGGPVTFLPGLTEVRLNSLVRITRAMTVQGPGRDALTIRYTGVSAVSGLSSRSPAARRP